MNRREHHSRPEPVSPIQKDGRSDPFFRDGRSLRASWTSLYTADYLCRCYAEADLLKEDSPDSENLPRLLLYLLEQTAKGHLRVPLDSLSRRFSLWLPPEERENQKERGAALEKNLPELLRRHPRLFSEDLTSRTPFLLTKDRSRHLRCYLNRVYRREQKLTRLLDQRIGHNYPGRPPQHPERGSRSEQDPWHQAAALSLEEIREEARLMKEEVPGARKIINNRIAEGVFLLLRNRFVILSGGPGSGKTTTLTYWLRLLIRLLRRRETPFSCTLTAPTGRAAKRILESMEKERERLSFPEDAFLPQEASTLHRLLKWGRRRELGLQRKEMIATPLLITDESSMLTPEMMISLLEKLPASARLVLIGDPDQLPSVGAGSLFSDFLAGLRPGSSPSSSPADHKLRSRVLHLTKSYRSDKTLLELAGHIIRGETEAFRKKSTLSPESFSWEDLPDKTKILPRLFSFCRGQSPGEKQETLFEEQTFPEVFSRESFSEPILRREHCRKEIKEAFDFFNRQIILSPLKRGFYGTDFLNRRLSLLWKRHFLSGSSRRAGENPSSRKESFSLDRRVNDAVYHGQPLLITENDYRLDLFNGDRGIVFFFAGDPYAFFPASRLSGEAKRSADAAQNPLDREYRFFSVHRLKNRETSYVQSIHKSQGSEFDRVLLVLPEETENFLFRELLYTALTRARKKVELLSSEETLFQGVSRPSFRDSGLRDFLENIQA